MNGKRLLQKKELYKLDFQNYDIKMVYFNKEEIAQIKNNLSLKSLKLGQTIKTKYKKVYR
jgi:hypothetical protein